MPSRKKALEPEVRLFLDALPESARPLLESRKGTDIVEEIGLDVVRGVVLDVMRGINIRDSTEPLTRRRIALLNAAMVAQYTSIFDSDLTVESLIESIVAALEGSKVSRGEQWMLNWSLGLTDKAIQNVLRDDHLGLPGYAQRFLDTVHQVSKTVSEDFGELSGMLRIGDREVPLNWFFVLYLATGLGSQTLTIRGSEKALYGKLFERLILGSVLYVLGFEFVTGSGPTDVSRRQFWLSTTSKRESDATLLMPPGRGMYFDIGFIGRGNPEITLDKVSRFERTTEFAEREHGMATFIIVDKIGARSRVEELASQIEGEVIQMSMSYWPQLLARKLHARFDDYTDGLINAEHSQVHRLLEERMKEVPIERLLRKADSDFEQ